MGEMKMNNPISDRWYADPESRVYNGKVYIYVTNSLPFEEQKNLDLVVTEDLENFREYRDILDMSTFRGADRAIWAPTVVEKDGRYYIVFAANDIHSEEEIGGLYLGVSDTPEGPFRNVYADGRPFINAIYNGAQPIDAHFFKDEDGAVYLYYGGWGHMMAGRMTQDMTALEPMPEPCIDGRVRELTPDGYMEAPCMMIIDGKYHLMYSAGHWEDDSYRVKAAVSDGPCSEFTHYGDLLAGNAFADAPGHNSAFYFNGQYYTAYHRRHPNAESYHNRMLCIDKLDIQNGYLQPITMT